MAEMFRLAVVPPPSGEDAALAAVVKKVEATRTVVTLPTARTIRTRLENSSGSAGPGPSGQRLKYIQQMARTKVGMRAIHAFASIELRDRWTEADGQLWHQGILEPIDQGEAALEEPADPSSPEQCNCTGRKLSPVGRTEALVKLVHSCKWDERLPRLRSALPTKNLTLHPDGVHLTAKATGAWIRGMTDPMEAGDLDEEDLLAACLGAKAPPHEPEPEECPDNHVDPRSQSCDGSQLMGRAFN